MEIMKICRFECG